LLKKVKSDLHFALECIIFVIAKRESGEGSRFLQYDRFEKMVFLQLVFCFTEFFFGVY
jgi:hypothetical protein